MKIIVIYPAIIPNTIATEVSESERGQPVIQQWMRFLMTQAVSTFASVGGGNVKQINAGDGVDELSTNAGEPQCDCTLDEGSDYTSLCTRN
ncbi:unnamed protein product [Euphydryas editha]|uniref:Uncharacterized protein n=1 Tax=Euphydryas editha TaxID=104508 RepID=A0AAU9TYH6_EUPED|nr:unnamed protein product [Euphydryas editha]